MIGAPGLVQYLLFLAMLAAGVGLFAVRMRNKIRLLTKFAPENRFDRPAERVKKTLVHVFGQKRILKDPATGLMHAFIFWGFCVLGVQTASLFLGTLVRYNFAAALGDFYAWPKDLFIVLVFLAVIYAFFRRLVVRPARVESSGEAYLVLGLILVLMMTDMKGAAAEQALTGHSFGFLGKALAPLMAWLSPEMLSFTWQACFWVQAAVILAFLNILPGSKHFHVITSLFNVYFRKLTPMGKLRTLDLEDENAESFGVAKATELDWKVVMDLYSCTECGRCHEHCPTHTTDKPLSPKRMNDHLKHYVYGHEKEILAGKGAELPDLYASETVGTDELWACTTCGYCEKACPLFIEQIQWITDFRRYKTLSESEFPEELQKAFKGLENNSNPWGIGAHKRAEWAEGLDVPVVGEAESFEYLYYVGCSGSFDDRNRKIARAFATLLKKAGVSFAILGEAEGCCGDAARRTGNEYLFQTLAQGNVEIFKEAGVKKILTTCPHGYNTLKNEYPEFGGTYEVWHHTQFLEKLVKEGKLKPVKSFEAKITFHDSCYLGRYNAVYDAPRALLGSVRGVKLAEMALNRDKGFCCGGGGGRVFMEESLGTRINHKRMEHVKATGCGVAATACPFCMTMLSDGVKETNLEGVEVRDVAEILLDAVE
ncbi:MAG: (Fe-S)-binding protein [Acidobacteria bacterium]|nr:(Fe-S)-binding protein [Acidobacteriota bacterium]